MDTALLKKSLRSETLKRRDALSPDYRSRAADAMADQVGEFGIAKGAVVSGFWPMRTEVDVHPLMAAFAEIGARICLPAILDRTTIVFREYTPDGKLIDMGFGTMGPPETAAVLDPTVMLVPLVAFDNRGHRIGYGAGYYDRAIAGLHAKGILPRLIGVAFDCQQVDFVPNEPHDIRLSEMLTESGLRAFEPG
ncbi:5-formyltetrahydrofolate cyclo-ligase [Tianweitania sp. BSSL-BM11]|uniref:5-formyltetrahydrofolate cyclo-ligase n=1 Tax=Tianweitania aestuarii TaxID=2814886 RepID=A0ABS5S273_9HYPH|nr:5-formyltetrahydrofolate cyclo-ligase [Tianweitania aestuarii]MBS9722594.1 5-formyltetrahydrofolate cyclo-ligase [Tianweitania aestuarii]